MNKYLMALIAFVPLIAHSGWIDAGGKPISDTESVRSAGDFGVQIVLTADADQFRDFAAKIGLGTWEESVFYLSAEYRGGDLIGTLEAIASAGINIEFIDALLVASRFGVLIWVDDADVDKLVHILSAA